MLKFSEITNQKATDDLLELVKNSDNPNEIDRLITEEGADCNGLDSDGNTPLFHAVRLNRIESVGILLQHGSNPNNTPKPNKFSWQNYPLLYIAIIFNHLEIVKLLINAKAEIELSYHTGNTPLLIAAAYDRSEAVKILIDSGANVNAVDIYGNTALMFATLPDYRLFLKENLEELLVELLLELDDVDEVNDLEEKKIAEDTYLINIPDNHLGVIKALLNAKANPNIANIDGHTALLCASMNCKQEALKILIEAGANVDAADELGRTALMYSALYAKLESLKILIEAKANVNAVNGSKNTALMYAATNGELEALNALINAGANVHIQDILGRTALVHAAINGKLEALKTLIDAGANVDIEDIYRNTALMYATEKKHLKLVKFLLQKSASSTIFRTLCLVAQSNNSEEMKTLIKSGADVEGIYSNNINILGLFPRYFTKRFLLPILEEAIDIGNTEVLAIFCKHAHYRKELSKLDDNDTTHNRAIIKKFINFLVEYDFIEKESNNDNEIDKFSKFDRYVSWQNAMDKLAIKEKQDTLLIKEHQEKAPPENSKSNLYNACDFLFKATISLKSMDAGINFLRMIIEPSLGNLNKVVRDAAHVGVMITDTSSFLPLVSAADSFIEIYNGKYTQALNHALETVVYMKLPTILGTNFAPLLATSALAYTSYKLVNNIYTFLTSYNTLETKLKSNIAYANVENSLGLKAMAWECLVNAKQIVDEDFEKYHDHNSAIQQIAYNHNLIGKLNELYSNYNSCDAY